MSNELIIIDYIIDEHKVIIGKLEFAGSSINEMQALSSLQKALSSTDVLAEKQKNLQETMDFLEEGIYKHFAYEEKMLPPLFGRVLMQTLIFEHQEIKKAMDEVKLSVSEPRPEGKSQAELASRGEIMQQATNRLCQMFEEHANREDIILKMMKRALEAGG